MSKPDSRPPVPYNDFATSYDKIWQIPGVRPLLPLLTSTLEFRGPVEGAAVLDLACGTGIGLRVARSLGAGRLVGVDISMRMLEVAKATTPPGTELHMADCSKPLDGLGLTPGSFGVVTGMWLLNYAASAAELAGMWRNIATYLKPGGWFVGTMENHGAVLAPRLQSGRYGVRETEMNELPSGEGFQVHVRFDTQPVVEFDAYRLRRAVFEREAAAAGLAQVEYARPGPREVKKMMAEGVGGDAAQNEDWWTDLLDEAPNLVVTARKRE